MLRMSRSLLIFALLVFVGTGCGNGIQYEYVWTRPTPADGRKTPTTFVVRIAIDIAARNVVWVEDVHDADGDLGRHVETWKDCSILDERNWDCSPVIAVGGDELVHVSMRDGKLKQKYWGEDRQFTTRSRVAGFTWR
jgi:hypothetical protein